MAPLVIIRLFEADTIPYIFEADPNYTPMVQTRKQPIIDSFYLPKMGQLGAGNVPK